MKPWRTLAADGRLVLRGRDGALLVQVDDHVLMGSRQHGSEDELPRLGCARLPDAAPRVLVGGLGFGYTLRATLDLLPPSAVVVVAEVSPAIATWNERFAGHLAGRPLDDARVALEICDVRDLLAPSSFDAILLDVDNGPAALTRASNASLYGAPGLALLFASLRAAGTLAVWSAGADVRFEERLRRAGFDARAVPVAAHARAGRHVIFVGVKGGRRGALPDGPIGRGEHPRLSASHRHRK